MKTAATLLALALAFGVAGRAAEEPQLVEVVDFSKLLPILPNPPEGWTADKAEGSTDDIGGTKITKAGRTRSSKFQAPSSSEAPITKPSASLLFGASMFGISLELVAWSLELPPPRRTGYMRKSSRVTMLPH